MQKTNAMIEAPKASDLRNDHLFAPFILGLKEMFSAEKQWVKTIPKWISAATLCELQSALREHLRETEGQVARLEQAFNALGEAPEEKSCAAMEGLLAEGCEAIKENDENSRNAAIIASAQKVEHYEIATYGTLRAWAAAMAQEEIAELFDETLKEEKSADSKLTEIAGTETPHAVEY